MLVNRQGTEALVSNQRSPDDIYSSTGVLTSFTAANSHPKLD